MLANLNAKSMYVVRQTHHERKKVNKFNITTVRPEPVEGELPGVLQVPQETEL